ncbi:DUF5799 family protein [Halovivax cerinus]|uniref:DUF5799 family protein n=1 Tax=Halovivax cerinus TaxID=1487865 RepID=A0ABD5NNE5_9EURY|nr:DUF5799 family protein [Halovivax cerinus]
MTESWTDRIVGERMALDREFSNRIADSRFTNQEWSLIMTATTFEIEGADDPESARLVANTEQVEHVLPEFESLRTQSAGLGGAGGESGRSGLIDSIKSAVGMGDDGVSEEERQAADALAQEYAGALQSKLESNGRWNEILELAAST